MTEFDVEVRTMIPASRFKQLQALAVQHHTTVGALVAELTRRAMTPKRKPGRPSRYTPELGERILEARWMHHSWAQIAAEEHLNEQTVRKYHDIAEAAQTASRNTNPKESTAA